MAFNLIINNMSNSSIFEKTGSAIANDTRVLVIDYPKGTSIIQVQGTIIAPEFGSIMVTCVMALAILGVVGASIAIRQKGLSHRYAI